MLHFQRSTTLLLLALFFTLPFQSPVTLAKAEEIVSSGSGVRGASSNAHSPTSMPQSNANDVVEDEEEDDSPMSKHEHDREIEVLKKELKWGMQEMARYQSVRGAWPVRNPGDGWSPSHAAEREDRQNNLAGEVNYWDMLLSLF